MYVFASHVAPSVLGTDDSSFLDISPDKGQRSFGLDVGYSYAAT
jgi:hypothetical protein